MNEKEIELKIGYMKNKEIALWMGISANTFNKNKSKYLEELEEYAIFHLEDKKVIIDEIIDKNFVNKKDKVYREVRKLVPKFWNKNGLDTCSNVSVKIYNASNFSLSLETIRKYVLKAKNELYGKIEKGRKFAIGKIGNSKYIYCKKDIETNEYKLFTKEEENKIKEIRFKYFGDANEVQDIVNDMIFTKEIEENEGLKVLNRLTNWTKDKFLDYKAEIEVTFNCYFVRATLIENNAFIDLDKFLETGEIVTFTLDLGFTQ